MMFERIMSGAQTGTILSKIDRARNVALLCMNDDVSRPTQDAEVSRRLREWFGKRWARPAAWAPERTRRG